MEGDSPYLIPKEEVREGDIPVMELTGGEAPPVAATEEVSTRWEEASTEPRERLRSFRRPKKAPAIDDLIAEAYVRIALGPRGLLTTIHEGGLGIVQKYKEVANEEGEEKATDKDTDKGLIDDVDSSSSSEKPDSPSPIRCAHLGFTSGLCF
ncbi:uncharacterized protein A4U43_C05F24700 [Asparagus officinalis]|uniref:Uncharacterized protein n=1 Tax=Asparagus officinalis TaxID=4686 RepID=A0A5P1EVN1_ASPOF|nr:uncharacterized protein A4U43_C05F24700 [Asparagus officinalis]